MRLKDFVKQSGGTTSDLFNLPLSVLRPNPDNIRLDTGELRDHIRGIADSIKSTGYLRSRPFTVRLVGDVAEIVDGNCRFAACQIAVVEGAELLTVPCMLEAPGTTEAERTANMLLANSGMAHSPLEMTVAIKKLLSYGWTDTQIARRLGKSRQYVANLLDLAAAPSDVRQAISNGTISATQALKVVRSEGADAGAVIAAVAEKARAEGRSRVTARAFGPVVPETSETIADAWAELSASKSANILLEAGREVVRLWDAGAIAGELDQAMGRLRAVVAPVGEMAMCPGN
jgi:ParB family transcriptional regulator, chromosome partitioning protein